MAAELSGNIHLSQAGLTQLSIQIAGSRKGSPCYAELAMTRRQQFRVPARPCCMTWRHLGLFLNCFLTLRFKKILKKKN